MITALHQVFGRQYAGFAYWAINTNIANPTANYFGISTINGNIEIDWKDGSSKTNYITTKNTDTTLSINNNTNVSLMPPHTFPSNFIQDVEIKCLSGLNDVYSLYFGGYGIVINQDFSSFLNQFPNLYSINIDIPHSVAYLNGDISLIPNKVEKIYIRDLRNSGNLYLNISNFNVNSQLKEFKSIYGQYGHNGFTNIYGDLSKLPPLIKIFTLRDNLANTLTYTAGRTWASSFDTLDLGNATMSYSDIDNLLNDMANSITTAIGSKIIRLANCYRTPASNTAVAYLQSLGFTITVLGTLTSVIKILDLPLQNNFIDTTGINTMIAGGTSNLPTFALSGRKDGEYCAVFNGSQSIKTTANLAINSDKVTIAFWIKTTQTTRATLGNGSSIDLTLNAWAGTLGIYTNGNAGGNAVTTQRNFVNWTHIVMIYDRILGKDQGKIYVNGVLNFSQKTDNYANNIGNFVESIFILGQSVPLTQGFNGSLTKLKIYNYPFISADVLNLYNSEL